MFSRCAAWVISRMLGRFRTARAVGFSRLTGEIVDFCARARVHLLYLILIGLRGRFRLLVPLILMRPRTGAPFHIVETHRSPPCYGKTHPTVSQMSKTRAEHARSIRRPSQPDWRSSCSRVSSGGIKPEEESLKRVIALALIVLGVVALAYGNISFTREKKVVDLGPVEVTKDKRETIPLSPIAGGVFLVAGIALLAIRPRD
jgi:hypothetical protein